MSLLGAAAGAAAVASFLAHLPPITTMASIALAAAMCAIADQDRRQFRVPDAWNLAAGLIGLTYVCAAAWLTDRDVWSALVQAVLAMFLCFGALLAVRETFFRLRGLDGLGFGDVKLGATGGIWLDWDIFAVAVLIAALGALVFVSVASFRDRGWARDRRLPFALYLAPAIWLCWFVAQATAG